MSVTSRGNAQEAIYRDDKDRRDYYSVVFEICDFEQFILIPRQLAGTRGHR